MYQIYGKWLLITFSICVQWTYVFCQNQLNPDDVNHLFLELFIKHFGENDTVTEEQMQIFFSKVS